MALKYFTNAYKGNASDTIAINSDHVLAVFESVITNHETNELTEITAVFTTNGTLYQLNDSLLDVVSRFNESN